MTSFTAIDIIPLKGIIRKIRFVLLITLSFYGCDELDGDFHEGSYNGITIKKEVDNIPYHQSFALWGDNIFLVNAEGCCYVYNLITEALEGKMTLESNNYSIPHGNVTCFGKKLNEDSKYPLLYVSQWNGEGGCLVYELTEHESRGFNAELKQSIFSFDMPVEKYGSSLGDWVVDVDNSFIYSVKYHLSSSTTYEGNSLHICKYNLPSFDNSITVFNETDILDSFEISFVPYMQDKKIKNGILYIASGASSNTQKISLVDLNKKKIIKTIDLSFWGSEPEGLDISNGIIISFEGYNSLYSVNYD